MSVANAIVELSLDGPKLLEQLSTLGQIGVDLKDGGRTRIALTDAEKEGRDQLVSWMNELGLDRRHLFA